MNDLKIGDKVMISKKSIYYYVQAPRYSSNPFNIVGEVYSIETYDALPIKVSWSNGTTNSYKKSDLVLIINIAYPDE